MTETTHFYLAINLREATQALRICPGTLEIRIGDEGEHFDMSQLPDPLADENLLRHSGRGLLLMQAFMDEFQIQPRQPSGTEVRLVKHMAKAG